MWICGYVDYGYVDMWGDMRDMKGYVGWWKVVRVGWETKWNGYWSFCFMSLQCYFQQLRGFGMDAAKYWPDLQSSLWVSTRKKSEPLGCLFWTQYYFYLPLTQRQNPQLEPVVKPNTVMSYVDTKTELKNVQSSTWRFFKFRMAGHDNDKSFVHCKLCLDTGNE